jgi:hypothetical protein
MSFSTAFARVLSECNVPKSFQAWLLKCKIYEKDLFLLGAPNSCDRDLIDPCGLQFDIAEKIAIRLAFRICRTASEDEERARITAAASPGSVDIPTATLQDAFFRRHAFVLPSKRLLNDALVKELYHRFNKRPKQLKFYLPRQLLMSNSSTEAVGTNISVIGSQMSSTPMVFTEDPFDNMQLFKVLRAYFNSLTYVSISEPDWFPFHVGEELADQLLEWMNAKYGQGHAARRLPL